MTIEDVRARVQAIDNNKEDEGTAHSLEDRLFIAVLNEIACGTPIARQLAAEALRSRQIPFTRRTS